MFSKLLAILIYYKHNVHMLHWKVGGPNFQSNHEDLGDLYGEMETHIDQVAELGLQNGEDPLTLQEAMQLLNGDNSDYITVDPKLSYPEFTAFAAVLNMFTGILTEIGSICKNNTLSEAQRNDLGNLASWYSLRVNYLIPRRLIK